MIPRKPTKIALRIKYFLNSLKRLGAIEARFKFLQSKGIVTVGEGTYGLPNIYYWDFSTRLHIGNYCSIAEEVTFILGGEHRTDWLTTYPFSEFKIEWPEASAATGHPATKGDINIGNDVWIGHGATILSGVRIGNGAVIAAGSIVTSDIEPYSIAGGNPARHIKFRFDAETIERIENLAWWMKSKSELKTLIPDLLRSPKL